MSVDLQFTVDLEREIQQKLSVFDAFDGDVDDILSAFLLFQFREKELHHGVVRAFLGQMFAQPELVRPYLVEMEKLNDPPLTQLMGALRERGMIRRDVDALDLILAFQTLQLGLLGLWALEGPPFGQTERIVRLQMKLFSEGVKAGEAYEV